MASLVSRLAVGSITLSLTRGSVRVELDGMTRELPRGAVAAIFARYGRPLADDVPLIGEALLLDDEARLGAISYRSPVDVIANDHVVYTSRDGASLAVPAPLFTAALSALARAV